MLVGLLFSSLTIQAQESVKKLSEEEAVTLAIKNAVGKICLMADDDIEYLPNFISTIISAYEKNNNADVITFEAFNKDGESHMSYPKTGIHDKESLFKVNNIGITFRKESIQKNKVLYSPYFGVGAVFPGCTEYVFLRNAIGKGLKIYHQSSVLSIHRGISSGKKQGSDNAIFARTALRYKYFKWFSIPWLINYLRFILVHGYITRKELKSKFFVGIKAIKTYRRLEKEGKII
jgi:glycosyltransferase involved in cell wall biosynthesis